MKAESTFGNFKFTIDAEVSDTQRDALAQLGLLQLAQRSPATAAEKKMAGYDKRPAGFKRTSIAFSEENAAVLREALGKIKVPVGEDEKGNEITEDLLCDVTVSEYVPGEGSEPKFASERAKYVQRAGEGKLEALAAGVGYDGDLGDGTAEGAPIEFLRAIRAKVQEMAKSL